MSTLQTARPDIQPKVTFNIKSNEGTIDGISQSLASIGIQEQSMPIDDKTTLQATAAAKDFEHFLEERVNDKQTNNPLLGAKYEMVY